MKTTYIVRAGFKGGRHVTTEYDTRREAAHTAQDHAFLLGLEAGDSWFFVSREQPRSGLENATAYVSVERVVHDGTVADSTAD